MTEQKTNKSKLNMDAALNHIHINEIIFVKYCLLIRTVFSVNLHLTEVVLFVTLYLLRKMFLTNTVSSVKKEIYRIV